MPPKSPRAKQAPKPYGAQYDVQYRVQYSVLYGVRCLSYCSKYPPRRAVSPQAMPCQALFNPSAPPVRPL